MEMRCFWPPLKLIPLSPISVLSPAADRRIVTSLMYSLIWAQSKTKLEKVEQTIYTRGKPLKNIFCNLLDLHSTFSLSGVLFGKHVLDCAGSQNISPVLNMEAAEHNIQLATCKSQFQCACMHAWCFYQAMKILPGMLSRSGRTAAAAIAWSYRSWSNGKPNRILSRTLAL